MQTIFFKNMLYISKSFIIQYKSGLLLLIIKITNFYNFYFSMLIYSFTWRYSGDYQKASSNYELSN